jgi:hypothetical protein
LLRAEVGTPGEGPLEVLRLRTPSPEARSFLRSARRYAPAGVPVLDGDARDFRAPGRAVFHDLLAAEVVLSAGGAAPDPAAVRGTGRVGTRCAAWGSNAPRVTGRRCRAG